MTSTLQKLFRKKWQKPQAGSQQAHERASSLPQDDFARAVDRRQGRPKDADQEYHFFTVSSLNSPSTLSVHGDSVASSSHGVASYHSPAEPSIDKMEYERMRASSFDSSMLLNSRRESDKRVVQVDQFGCAVQGDLSIDGHQSQASKRQDDEEDEETDKNALYGKLVHEIDVSPLWSSVKLLLVPRSHQLKKIDQDIMQRDDYAALHALMPSNLFKDQFEAITLPSSADLEVNQRSRIRLSATLHPELQSVHVVIARSSEGVVESRQRFERMLKVTSETTLYCRTLSQSTNLPKRAERVRIRVLFVNDIVVPTRLLTRRLSKPPASAASSKGTMKNIARKGSTQFGAEEEQASTVTFPTQEKSKTSDGGKSRSDPSVVPSKRYLLDDFVYLLDPPSALGPLQGPLRVALQTIERAATDFISAYVYVPGFDSYNASRIRRGILARSWRAFQEARKANGVGEDDAELSTWLGTEGRATLLLLLENVVMGYCHGKVYNSVCTLRHESDEHLDCIIATYLDHNVSLSDIGVAKELKDAADRARFDLAQAILTCLGEPEEDFDYIFGNKNVAQIRTMAAKGQLPDSYDHFDLGSVAVNQTARYRIRTPLDALEVMHATLNEICSAVSSTRRATSPVSRPEDSITLGTDDILPLLAIVVIRSAPRKLTSLLYYIRHFGISDATLAKHSWALTTFEAVVKYLQSDPLALFVGGLDRALSQTSVRSARSSIRSRTPSVTGSVQMDRGVSTDERERLRRVSLPTSSVVGKIAASELEASTGSNLRPAASVIVKDLSSPQHVDAGDQSSFKRPGNPASATNKGKTVRPPLATCISELPPSGETLLDSTDSVPMDRRSSMHKRASSMSADLLIRPQIVVRAPAKGRDGYASSVIDRPLLSRESSISSSVFTPEKTDRFGQQQTSNKLSVEARRRSVDSWSSLSAFGGGMRLIRGDSSQTVESNTDQRSALSESPLDPLSSDVQSEEARTSTNTASQGIGMQSKFGSSNWLPIWPSEWGSSGRSRSIVGIERQNSGSAQSHSRPGSIKSQDGGGSGISLAPARSSLTRTNSALGLPSLDSMPSLEAHETMSATEVDESMSVGSLSDISNVLSSPASVHSFGLPHSSEQASAGEFSSRYSRSVVEGKPVVKPRRGHNSTAEGGQRRRSRTRSRLLSASSPSEPLPPRLTTSDAVDALPGLFEKSARLDALSSPRADQSPAFKVGSPESAASSSSSNALSRAKMLGSSDSIASMPATKSRSEAMIDHVTFRNSFALNNQTSDSLSYSSSSTLASPLSTWAGPGAPFSKLQIPSPVDERTDPMSPSSSTKF